MQHAEKPVKLWLLVKQSLYNYPEPRGKICTTIKQVLVANPCVLTIETLLTTDWDKTITGREITGSIPSNNSEVGT